MPKFLDRATRMLVTQYFNGDAFNKAVEPWPRSDAAPEAKVALERILDACAEAEKNAERGRSPMVTVHWIRKQITDALDA